MNKEIKIINYVFKYKDKINLVSIEEYINYPMECSKVKYIIEDKYFENSVVNKNISEDRLMFDNLTITEDFLEFVSTDYRLKLRIDNQELLNNYFKKNKGKNDYLLTKNERYFGTINEEEVSGKIFVDYESISTILDTYYKIYTIDFLEFNGCFNLVVYDKKTPNIYLRYKDLEIFNKRICSVKKHRIFKMSTYKLTISGNNFWKVNLKVNKSFKSNPSVIPFKYQKGILSLVMKKHIFKTSLRTMGNEMLLISYKYI